MRILLVSHGAGPYGAERVLLAAARGLAGRGHDVVLELPHGGPALDEALRTGGFEVRVGGRRPLPRTRREIPAFLLAAPAAVAAVWRLVRRVEPDVVWVSSIYNPFAAAGARLAGRPVAWHLHERVPSFPAGAVLAVLLAATTRRAVAVSGFVARSLARYPGLGKRIAVVHNPVLDEAAGGPVEEPGGPFTVGCIGQLEPRKRTGDVLRAVASVPGVRAILVGGGKARGEVEAMTRELGIEDRVALRGFRADVRAEAARFHCLAVPSLDEGFGLVALEGIALGIPVVAARSGALPEVLGDAALYFEPGDADGLADQLRRLRDQPDLRRELRDRGPRRAEAFARDRWLDALEGVLAEVAGPGGNA